MAKVEYNTAFKQAIEQGVTLAPLDRQIGGNHYRKFKIQPAEFCHVNNIGYLEATAIKYLCRWRDKGGFEDLDKAVHFIELLKQLEGASNGNPEHWSKTGRDPF